MGKSERVIQELQRRAARGQPLNSGANRGDWLSAAAVLSFGSWKGAVEAAGFAYQAIKIRPLTKQEVIDRLKALAATGDPILANEQESKLGTAAVRHFGSWKEAAAAAGGVAGPTKWTPQRVLEAIRADIANGLPAKPLAFVEHNPNLYAAGRRRFGAFAAALEAATGQTERVVKLLRAEKGRRLPMTSGAVHRRNPRLHADAIARPGAWQSALLAAFPHPPHAQHAAEAAARVRRK